MTSLAVLLHKGAGGLPPAVPLDSETLVLPKTPNFCLAGPPGYGGPKQLTIPVFQAPPDRVWAALALVAAGRPRCAPYLVEPAALRGQWVERSRLMNYPDIIAAEVRPEPGGAGLLIFSRSLFGHSDLGVNRKRVEAWLAEIRSALTA